MFAEVRGHNNKFEKSRIIQIGDQCDFALRADWNILERNIASMVMRLEHGVQMALLRASGQPEAGGAAPWRGQASIALVPAPRVREKQNTQRIVWLVRYGIPR
eukprot:6268498-Amphidinium_carterae.1